MTAERQATSAERLDEHLTLYPHLTERILRQMLVELHSRDLVNIDEIYDRARAAGGHVETLPPSERGNPNVAEAPRGDQQEKNRVNEIAKECAAQHLSPHEIDELVNLTLKREEADNLRAIVSLASVSFRMLADKIRRFCALPEGEMQLARDEAMGIRVGLIRHFISDQLEFIAIAKRYLRIRDFQDIINRVIGPETSMGRVGGKSAGIIVASKILNVKTQCGPEPISQASGDGRHGPGNFPVAVPESYYLRSDVIEDFIAFNQLGEYQSQKYKDLDEIRREHPLVKSVFRNAAFPAGTVAQLRGVLERIGTHPLIVRSSSLLEDRFGTAFSGKYASIFLANQGKPERRLQALLGAIAEVFASALGPDPILYRREHDLLDYEEDMAVLIQKVVGRQFGDYFAPVLAGVALSRNEYRWSPRIKRDDGLVRFVMGLGTRAVDRIGTESARLVALGMPTLRPESSTGEIMRRSQRTIDVINLAKNRMESIPLQKFMEQSGGFPMLDKIVSIRRDGMLHAPTGTYIDAEPADLCITFDKLLSEGGLTEQLRGILKQLERGYGVPVDVEFAHDGERLYLLQCRTLAEAKQIANVAIPADIAEERTIFSARKFVHSALIENVECIVYIDPRDYDAVPTREKRRAIARVIGLINQRLERRSFILIGPGRWGSNDVRLGVPVTYADINRTKMLIEVAREREGYVPEVSYGTHFFQDLIEADIAYLPLYPDDRRNRFNETFLSGSPNSLSALLPDHAELGDVVRVIDIPAVAGGRRLRVVMDGKADQALAYLVDAREAAGS